VPLAPKRTNEFKKVGERNRPPVNFVFSSGWGGGRGLLLGLGRNTKKRSQKKIPAKKRKQFPIQQ